MVYISTHTVYVCPPTHCMYVPHTVYVCPPTQKEKEEKEELGEKPHIVKFRNRSETVQFSTVQYSTVQYNTVQYNTVQYITVQYGTVQYSTALCYTRMH